MTTGCLPWPITWPCDVEAVEEPIKEQARAMAEHVLWGLSGRRLGACTYVEGYYPACSDICGMPYKGTDGLWRNGGAASDCCRLLLQHRPIISVEKVTENGVELPSDQFAWGHTYLRRRGACWPCGDECESPPVLVEYTAGVGFPIGTEEAMGELACEVLKAWNNEVCKLPSRATSVSRQGVTVTMADPSAFTKNGLLGLPVADLWLRAVNPVHLSRPSRVYSPDLARMEHSHSKGP